MELLICLVILGAVLVYVYKRLVKTNMDVPETAEVAVDEPSVEYANTAYYAVGSATVQ